MDEVVVLMTTDNLMR